MKYANIKFWDIANGPGIRTSLFVSGCEFHCQGCFNQEQQSFDYGKKYTQKTEDEIIKQIYKPYIAGLSILGGDPLWQDITDIRRLEELCDNIYGLNKTVWLWTGFTWETIFNNADKTLCSSTEYERMCLISRCDYVVDGQFIEPLKDHNLLWRGSSNQRIIDVKKTLPSNQIVLYKED